MTRPDDNDYDEIQQEVDEYLTIRGEEEYQWQQHWRDEVNRCFQMLNLDVNFIPWENVLELPDIEAYKCLVRHCINDNSLIEALTCNNTMKEDKVDNTWCLELELDFDDGDCVFFEQMFVGTDYSINNVYYPRR